MSKVSALMNAETRAVFPKTLTEIDIKQAVISNRSTDNPVHKVTMQPYYSSLQVFKY